MLNTNEGQRQRSANKDYQLKLTFEAQLMRKLKPMFRKLAKDFQTKYAALGLFPDLTLFAEEMKNVLQAHYGKVSKKFSQRVVSELGKPENHDNVLGSIDRRTDTHHTNRAQQSAQVITNTTRKDMRLAIAAAVAAGAALGLSLNRSQVASRARIDLNRRTAGRTLTIAMTETQNPAEHAKQTEVEMLSWHDSFINGESIRLARKQKKWVAILDTRTRHAHAEADNQVVNFAEPYTVGGQSLMYPGDQSLGASLDNVINCRCSSVIIIR